MGQFKPMVKMMTTEPTVELKLKKGGHVAKKAYGGVMPVPVSSLGKLAARGGSMDGAAPMAPSMMARRKAMAAPLLMSKKGGKAGDKAQDKAMIKKAFKQHDAQEHKGGKGTMLKLKKGGMYASGGAIDKFETKTTIEGNAGKFAKTKMDTAKKDRAHGTGAVKEGKPAGYKVGGKVPDIGRAVEGNEAKFALNNVDDGDKFDPAHGTKGVRESNAGGYKKGGHTKKAYATGGNVVDDGKAEKMPRHFISRPVANSLQSGTFKKGGKVDRKADGGLEDMSKGAYDKAVTQKPVGSGFAGKVQGAIDKFFGAKKPAGSVTETKETVTTSKKNGGKC